MTRLKIKKNNLKSASMMSWPDEKELAPIRERLSDPHFIGSSVLPPHATELDRMKYKACEAILKYRKKNEITQKKLAELLKIDESRMSEVLHYKVENFTLDRLVGYTQILYPNLKLDLIAA